MKPLRVRNGPSSIAVFGAFLVSIIIATTSPPVRADSRLLGINNGNVEDVFLEFDVTTGIATPLGATNLGSIFASAYDPSSGNFYAILVDNTNALQLVIIDPDTTALTIVGPITGAPLNGQFRGMTYDPAQDRLLANTAYSAGFGLFSIDRTTGAATLITPLSLSGVSGLELHPPTNTLYGVVQGSGYVSDVVTIDATTGLVTVLNTVNIGGLRSLTYDPPTDRFYSIGSPSVGESVLVTIDPTTGGATLVNPGTYTPPVGTLTLIPSATSGYLCQGYFAPFDRHLSLRNKSKGTIPIKLTLQDESGQFVTSSDLASPPVVNVTFSGVTYGNGTTDDESLDPVGFSNEGNVFSFNTAEQLWEYRLGTKQFSSQGTYQVEVLSGDQGEYIIDTSGGTQCTGMFTRQP